MDPRVTALLEHAPEMGSCFELEAWDTKEGCKVVSAVPA